MIVDLRLKDQKTGIQVIEAVNAELNAKIPAIIITGDILPGRLRAVQEGGYRFLHKPISPQVLFEEIDLLLEI
jgi:CheY-like chemotaxis protein